MTIAVGILAATLLATLASCGQLLRWQQRSHARREDQLLNQLLHLAGKPWESAPADSARPQPREVAEPGAPRFTATPEAYNHFHQLPDVELAPPFEPGIQVPSDWGS